MRLQVLEHPDWRIQLHQPGTPGSFAYPSSGHIAFKLPLPPRALSPNVASHRNWRARHKAAKVYRAGCTGAMKVLLREICTRGWGMPGADLPLRCKASVDIEYYLAPVREGDALGLLRHHDSYRPTDADNAVAAAKCAIDALVDCGLLAGDTGEHLELGRCRIYRLVREHLGRTELVLTVRWPAKEEDMGGRIARPE